MSARRRCPACKRDIRLKGPADAPVYFRHPLNPPGSDIEYGDHCVNSDWPVAHEYVCGDDNIYRRVDTP